jgi:CRP/FNR family transcriptional regulator
LIQVKEGSVRRGPNIGHWQFEMMMVRVQSTEQQLRRIPLFRGLPQDKIKQLAGAAAHRDLLPGERLYQQDDSATACFVLMQGSIRFSVRLGRKVTVAGLAFVNDVFGLEALRKRAKRPETAISMGRSALLEIDRDFLKQFLLENPDFQLSLLDYLVEKLDEKSAHALQTGHYDAEQRIAAYLIKQSRRAASANRGRKMLSQADVAEYLALTPETFCRKVNKFRQLGWIEGSGNEYVVKKHEALRELLKQ